MVWYRDRRVWSIITIYLETILFCQALGGWPAIEWILRYYGYYDDKCPGDPPETPCDEQDRVFSKMYSLTYCPLES